ncbi:unnamed protein product [Alternaria alternata]
MGHRQTDDWEIIDRVELSNGISVIARVFMVVARVFMVVARVFMVVARVFMVVARVFMPVWSSVIALAWYAVEHVPLQLHFEDPDPLIYIAVRCRAKQEEAKKVTIGLDSPRTSMRVLGRTNQYGDAAFPFRLRKILAI